MNGKEMLINSLVKALGLDKTLAENVGYGVETVMTFDKRLARCERLLELIATHYGVQDHAEPSGQPTAAAGLSEYAGRDGNAHSLPGHDAGQAGLRTAAGR